MTTSNLVIKNFDLPVYLGWDDEEREQKQSVLLTLKIKFIHTPAAIHSDDLKDTICYRTLLASLQEDISDKSFKLIEKLAAHIYLFLKKIINIDCRLKIILSKFPPIEGLNDGVRFSYGDF